MELKFKFSICSKRIDRIIIIIIIIITTITITSKEKETYYFLKCGLISLFLSLSCVIVMLISKSNGLQFRNGIEISPPYKDAFAIVILQTKSAILNQIAENVSFESSSLKNCDLKTQKDLDFQTQVRRCFFFKKKKKCTILKTKL
jgi:Fe-S-cluster containining protein